MTGLLDSPVPGRSHEPRSARLPREDRRRQIIEEATRIIGQRGYYGFSMQELADSCGLTVAGLLHHTGSKEALLISLLRARDQRDRDALGEWARLSGEEDETRQPAIGDAADLLRRIVIRNSTQPELVRLYSMLRAESLYPGHPAHEYFTDRDEQVLGAFTRLFGGLANHPESLARQLLALMTGLEEQWLHAPAMDLVREWDRAMETIMTSVNSPSPRP